MSWINRGNYCVNKELLELGFSHAISTRKSGNLKDPKLYENFLSFLSKQESLFEDKKLKAKTVFIGEQKHTDNFFEIVEHEFNGLVKNNDGFISKFRDVKFGVFTADCMPIFVVNPKQNVAALLHSGWRGVEQNIVGKCLDFMSHKYSCDLEQTFIAIGPHLKSCCYEVGEEFKKFFEIEEKMMNGEKKIFLDMEKNLTKILLKIGIKPENIFSSNFCTGCNNDLFFSYRFDNKTDERMLSILTT